MIILVSFRHKIISLRRKKKNTKDSETLHRKYLIKLFTKLKQKWLQRGKKLKKHAPFDLKSKNIHLSELFVICTYGLGLRDGSK